MRTRNQIAVTCCGNKTRAVVYWRDLSPKFNHLPRLVIWFVMYKFKDGEHLSRHQGFLCLLSHWFDPSCCLLHRFASKLNGVLPSADDSKFAMLSEHVLHTISQVSVYTLEKTKKVNKQTNSDQSWKLSTTTIIENVIIKNFNFTSKKKKEN